MPKFLQSVLGTSEPFFNVGLMKLERATGQSGVDTRLIADMTTKAHAIMRQLGLKPSDTTGPELYQALMSSVGRGVAQALLLDADYVLLVFGGQIISFNLIDVINNHHHQLGYKDQIASHGQRSLRGELVGRYVNHARTDNAVAKQIARSIGLLPEADQWYETTRSVGERTKGKVKASSMLSIGAIVTDAFIELKENQVKVIKDDKGFPQLIIPFGTKLPYQGATVVDAVGNSANAAVAFARLGLESALLADIGDDKTGKDMLLYLKSQNVTTNLIRVHTGQKSHYHYVLRYKADRTILIKYEDYDYGFYEPAKPPTWIYLSTISDTSWQAHVDLMDYLEKWPEVRFAFQPGAYHFDWGVKKLRRLYERTEIIILNREEAAIVTKLPVDSITNLAKALYALGPKIVVITDGPSGAYSYDGDKVLRMPNYPDPAPPYDRTGAGDAFASTFVAAIAQGESLETALKWAPINSMSVVQKLGAQAGLLSPKELTTLLAKAPSDYYPKEFKK